MSQHSASVPYKPARHETFQTKPRARAADNNLNSRIKGKFGRHIMSLRAKTRIQTTYADRTHVTAQPVATVTPSRLRCCMRAPRSSSLRVGQHAVIPRRRQPWQSTPSGLWTPDAPRASLSLLLRAEVVPVPARRALAAIERVLRAASPCTVTAPTTSGPLLSAGRQLYSYVTRRSAACGFQAAASVPGVARIRQVNPAEHRGATVRNQQAGVGATTADGGMCPCRRHASRLRSSPAGPGRTASQHSPSCATAMLARYCRLGRRSGPAGESPISHLRHGDESWHLAGC